MTRIGIENAIPPKHTATRVRLARCIAIVADAVQFGLLPLFFAGIGVPLNIALDVIVCVLMIGLLGFHIAFLPTFLFEAVPFLELAPTWTIAVFVATRRGAAPNQKAQPPIIDV